MSVSGSSSLNVNTIEKAASDLVERTPEESGFREQLESYSLGGTLFRERDPSRFGLTVPGR